MEEMTAKPESGPIGPDIGELKMPPLDGHAALEQDRERGSARWRIFHDERDVAVPYEKPIFTAKELEYLAAGVLHTVPDKERICRVISTTWRVPTQAEAQAGFGRRVLIINPSEKTTAEEAQWAPSRIDTIRARPKPPDLKVVPGSEKPSAGQPEQPKRAA